MGFNQEIVENHVARSSNFVNLNIKNGPPSQKIFMSDIWGEKEIYQISIRGSS